MIFLKETPFTYECISITKKNENIYIRLLMMFREEVNCFPLEHAKSSCFKLRGFTGHNFGHTFLPRICFPHSYI